MKAKTHPKPNLEQIAAILVDAELNTVSHVCKTHGITRTTLYRYRSRLKKDPELGRLVTTSLTACRPPVPVATAKAVVDAAYLWLRDNIPKLHPSPENVTAITAAVKTLRQQEMAERAMSEYITALRKSGNNQRTTREEEAHGSSLPN